MSTTHDPDSNTDPYAPVVRRVATPAAQRATVDGATVGQLAYRVDRARAAEAAASERRAATRAELADLAAQIAAGTASRAAAAAAAPPPPPPPPTQQPPAAPAPAPATPRRRSGLAPLQSGLVTSPARVRRHRTTGQAVRMVEVDPLEWPGPHPNN